MMINENAEIVDFLALKKKWPSASLKRIVRPCLHQRPLIKGFVIASTV